ncbi:MAG: transporter substrate-binding domain-containing protein [Ruminococcaceae bacterium]|nr:transporter substrate-binding domain-containing protein [Oscillospiraceae bacterium]
MTMKKTLSLVLALLMMCIAFASCAEKETKVAIGVQSGTTGESFLKGDADWGFEGFANVDTKAYDNAGLAVEDMKNGNIKYVVIDAAVGKELASKNKDIKVIDYALTKEDFGFGIDKAQPELLNTVNKVLAEKKDEIANIYKKFSEVNDDNAADWKGETLKSAEYDANKDQLVIATNAAFAPYEFVVGNEFAGIDIEIVKLIADELDMEVVINDMAFESVVTSIGKNGIDMAASGLTISPARAKIVNFSNPYEEGSYQVILAMKDDATFDGCKSAEDALAKLKELK